jgi:type VI protein secretion system component Hcp
MAVDAYLFIDGIKGESADDKHKQWIEVFNVTGSVHQPRAATVSTAGGHTTTIQHHLQKACGPVLTSPEAAFRNGQDAAQGRL